MILFVSTSVFREVTRTRPIKYYSLRYAFNPKIKQALEFLTDFIKMPMKLYKLDGSPPARAAMMACEIFHPDVEMVDMNIMKGIQFQPDFLKKNPIHSIPVLEDGDFVIHDSHAILMYLADAYGKDDSLYPKDLKKRADVNQKLFFDTAILFPRLRSITYPLFVEGGNGPNEKQLQAIDEAYTMTEQFLSKSKFLAGDHLTIADISAITDITSLVHILPLDVTKYPKTQAWIKEMEKQPYCKKYNENGAAFLGKIYKETLQSRNKK